MATTENVLTSESTDTTKYWLYCYGHPCNLHFPTQDEAAGYVTKYFPIDEYDNFTVVEEHTIATTVRSAQRAIRL